MDFNFILDKNYLAFLTLNKTMFNESKEIIEIKNKLYYENTLGYNKIIGKEYLDSEIYLKDEELKKLIKEFISYNKFNELYKKYNNDSKEIIAIKILKGDIKINDKSLDKIKDDLWFKNYNAYVSLYYFNMYKTSLYFLDKDVKEIIEKLKNTDEFKKIYNETKIYYDNVVKIYKEKIKEINNYLRKILKIDINIKPNVYIVNPKNCAGYSVNNEIVWGHYKGIEDPYYNLTYLVHEGLHCLLPFKKNEIKYECNIKHTIIELISDYELYSKLKGESTLKEGHDYLKEYKKEIYPYWLKYIGLNEKEIKDRLKKDSISFDKIKQIEDCNLLNMNIYQFINFCCEKYSLNNKKVL